MVVVWAPLCLAAASCLAARKAALGDGALGFSDDGCSLSLLESVVSCFFKGSCNEAFDLTTMVLIIMNIVCVCYGKIERFIVSIESLSSFSDCKVDCRGGGGGGDCWV